MSIQYLPTNPRGRQWTVVVDDGSTMAGVSRNDAAAALQLNGLSIRQAEIELTRAKLKASLGAA